MSDNTTTPQEAPKRRGNPNFGKQVRTAQATPEEETPGGQVQVQATDMDMLAEMKKMREELAEMRASRDALIASVDQTKFHQALAHTKEDKRLLVRLRLINDKAVIAWSNMQTNDVRYYKGEEIVDQTTTVTYVDGSQETLPYELVFNHVNKTGWLPVNSQKTDAQGKRSFFVEWEGQEVEVGEAFING